MTWSRLPDSEGQTFCLTAPERVLRTKLGAEHANKGSRNRGGILLTYTKLPPELVAAYRATGYWVGEDECAFCLRVDCYSELLAQLLHGSESKCAAFISAHNPFSNPSTPRANELAHERLRRELARRSACLVAGAGRDAAGCWPEEKSFLALGLGLEESREVGIRFRQNAIVWSGSDAVPHLILLR